MVCPKCGNECGKSNFCPKCGTKLIRTCKCCHKVLNDTDRFCPECGADNEVREEAKEQKGGTVGLIGFVLTLLFSVISIAEAFAVRGCMRFVFGGYFYRIPFFSIAVAFSIAYGLLVIFAILFRATDKKALGIIALVLACIIKLVTWYNFKSLAVLIGTIMSLCDREKK